jgi:tagaturonate epimerase
VSSGTLSVYPRSIVLGAAAIFALASRGGSKLLSIVGDVDGFEGEEPGPQGSHLFPLTPPNADALRTALPHLAAQPLGLRTSAGTGDRLGLATPGHARAAARFRLAPIFAQQSVRENARTGRSPRQVIDDATWGLFQEGWRLPWGADADHLKTLQDIPPFVESGYTFFTVDPGEHVCPVPPAAPVETLARLAEGTDWRALECSLAEMRQAYLARSFNLGGLTLEFSEADLLRCLVKYGGAVAHARAMYAGIRALKGAVPFDFELSVDETDEPTSPFEHFWIVSQLERLGVCWVSLAPRFVGAFEKGVDYIGDLGLFESELLKHAAILKHYGCYKLSLHSGSDKFSIYPIARRLCGSLLHLKTAGTSYLEALRVLAAVQPQLFRRILELSRARYPQDRISYHVSARLEAIPPAEALADADLPGLLNQFDAREVLHVCFGAALDACGAELKAFLSTNEDAYYAALEAHFARHFELLTGNESKEQRTGNRE